MRKVTRIGVLSLGKLMGGVGAVFGLFFGVVLTVISFFGASIAFAESGSWEGLFGLIFGVGAIFVLPILYGGFAFLQGIVTAFVANLAMRFFGGLEIELSDS